MVAPALVSEQVSMLPLVLLMRKLGLINTRYGVIIPSMAGMFGIVLARQYARAQNQESSGRWSVVGNRN